MARVSRPTMPTNVLQDPDWDALAHASSCIPIRVLKHIRTYMYMHIQTCICIEPYIYVHVHIYMYVHK